METFATDRIVCQNTLTDWNRVRRDRARNIRNLKKYGYEACRICWETCVIHGEGPTMQAINSGLHFNSTAAACNAYAFVLREIGWPTNQIGYLERSRTSTPLTTF